MGDGEYGGLRGMLWGYCRMVRHDRCTLSNRPCQENRTHYLARGHRTQTIRGDEVTDNPKERMWEEAINRQLDDTRGKGCLNAGEWIAVIVLTFVFAALIWHHFQ
jgi:hypothetical protein